MHNAELDFCLWIHRIESIRESDQPINGGDKDILNTSVLQFSHHAEPELCFFVLRNPKSQQLFLTCQSNG